MTRAARLALFCAAIAIAGPASAQQWVEIERQPSGNVLLYDPASVERAGDIVRLRIQLRVGKGGNVHYAREEINCRERRRRRLSLVSEEPNGNRSVFDEPQPEVRIEPGSLLARIHDTVCRTR